MAVYDMYVFHFSSASLAARYTAALGARSSPSAAAGPKLQLKLVNLAKGEQLSEEYLALNPKGQVPTLTGPTLDKPLQSSWDINDWLCEQYPTLLPEKHRAAIVDLLAQLKSPFVESSLTPPMFKNMPNRAEQLLQADNLSDTYRKALEAKSAFQKENASLTASAPDEEIAAKTKAVLDAVLAQYRTHGGGGAWLFGETVGPTALDGRVVPYLARLLDLGRRDLVGEELGRYAAGAQAGPEWQAVTCGRPTTLWNPSLGPVEALPL